MLAKFLLPFLVAGVLATPIPAGKEGDVPNIATPKGGPPTYEELFPSGFQRPANSKPEINDKLTYHQDGSPAGSYVGRPLGTPSRHTATRTKEEPASKRVDKRASRDGSKTSDSTHLAPAVYHVTTNTRKPGYVNMRPMMLEGGTWRQSLHSDDPEPQRAASSTHYHESGYTYKPTERQAAVAHKAALNNAPRPAVDKRASSTDPKAPAAHNAPQDADAFFIGTPAFLTRGVLGPNQYHPNSNNPAAGPPATSSNNQVQGRRKNPDEDVSHVAPPKRKHGDI